MDAMLNCSRKVVSAIVAVTCLFVPKPVLAEEAPLRTLAMMAPVERQAVIDAITWMPCWLRIASRTTHGPSLRN
jgi:hypothetical protein